MAALCCIFLILKKTKKKIKKRKLNSSSKWIVYGRSREGIKKMRTKWIVYVLPWCQDEITLCQDNIQFFIYMDHKEWKRKHIELNKIIKNLPAATVNGKIWSHFNIIRMVCILLAFSFSYFNFIEHQSHSTNSCSSFTSRDIQFYIYVCCLNTVHCPMQRNYFEYYVTGPHVIHTQSYAINVQALNLHVCIDKSLHFDF